MKKIYYGKAVYNNKEINAVLNVLRNSSLSLIDGNKVKQLEKLISKKFGKKYGLMVNSGSSANLLALSSFNFKKGSEVISERHQKDYKKEEEQTDEAEKTTESFTDVSFDDI